ncbi:hypothetical protein CEXT_632981 [Caerostris extrusa]|uniref:Uncharacterized protein n=1 Tax=Caerostris extrusa TaxID=172846 RepID=A0AAV4MX09_CAEEX|nr:hypothetical protein CEXT_632981 [Caerostris extrusa]
MHTALHLTVPGRFFVPLPDPAKFPAEGKTSEALCRWGFFGTQDSGLLALGKEARTYFGHRFLWCRRSNSSTLPATGSTNTSSLI